MTELSDALDQLDRDVVKLLRGSRTAWTLKALAIATRTDESTMAECLFDLCMAGPLVAIDDRGDCGYALEWGVKASWEVSEPSHG